MGPYALGFPSPRAPSVGWLAPAVCMLLLCGCSLMGHKEPKPMEVPTEFVGPPVTSEERPDSVSVPSPIESPVRSRATVDTTASRHRPAPPTVTEPVGPEPAAPSITIQLSDEERIRLTDETDKDVAVTNVCLQRLDRERSSPDQKQAISDIEDLLNAVAKAREENDIQAASRLARKARLLAEDLTGR
jgi:hypothetical protein